MLWTEPGRVTPTGTRLINWTGNEGVGRERRRGVRGRGERLRGGERVEGEGEEERR